MQAADGHVLRPEVIESLERAIIGQAPRHRRPMPKARKADRCTPFDSLETNTTRIRIE